MSIWRQLYGSLSGGWKTHGPAAIAGAGAFDSDSPYEAVTAQTALRLSAFWACLNLRAETIGSLPLHLRISSTSNRLFSRRPRKPTAEHFKTMLPLGEIELF